MQKLYSVCRYLADGGENSSQYEKMYLKMKARRGVFNLGKLSRPKIGVIAVFIIIIEFYLKSFAVLECGDPFWLPCYSLGSLPS